MNLKRGILIAIVLYISTLIVNTIITLVVRNTYSLQNNYTFYWLAIIISIVLLTGLSSIWYFTKTKKNTKEGLKLSAIFIITGFVIDFITFLMRENTLQSIKEYYSTTQYYIVLAIIIATCAFIGSQNPKNQTQKVKHKNKKHKKK